MVAAGAEPPLASPVQLFDEAQIAARHHDAKDIDKPFFERAIEFPLARKRNDSLVEPEELIEPLAGFVGAKQLARLAGRLFR